MGHTANISVCIFICTAFFPFTLNGQNNLIENVDALTSDNVNRTLLECQYDLMTGDHICDCYNRNTRFTLQLLNGKLNNLIVRNCRNLLVGRETFRRVHGIKYIHFMNINRLSLEKHSIAFKRIKPIIKIQLKFLNVNIHQMEPYAIDGCIDIVAFDRCHIEKFSAYTMNAQCLPVYRILIENTEIVSIEMHAFKKLNIDQLVLRNTTFQSRLPSRIFSALTITKEFSISNCLFTTINSRAIDLEDVNDFIFSDNRIEQLDAEAITLNGNGRIIIERNNFSRISHSAFSGIHVGENTKQSKMEIQFLSNVIGITDSPIRFKTDGNLQFRVLDLKFSKTIDCNEAEKLRPNSFLPQYAEVVYFRFDTEDEYSSLSNIWSTKCTVTTYMIAIVSTVVVLALILIILIVAIFYCCMLKRQPIRSIPMVIPDGKTYRETQIMMQIEHAGMLKTNL